MEDTIVRKDTKNDFYLVLGNENSATFTFSIQNSGNAPIKRPKALIASDSGTISFQCTRNASEFEQKCLIEPTFDMMPYAQVGLWNDFTVVAKIPVEVHDFTIYFSIWGDNAKEFTDRTKVTVILKYWWTFEDSEKAYEK